MTDVRQVRRKYTLVLAVLLCIDVVCGIVLISPIGRSARANQETLNGLWSDLQVKTRETIPLQGIDSKVKEAKTEIDTFLKDRVPQRFANVPDEVGKLAAAHNVSLSAARYRTEETDIPGLRRVVVEATLSGTYSQEAQFINAVERDKLFFIINSISLGDAQNGGVRLQIQMETYIRSEATA
jgi:Tfp pilus assembly protein PilO